MRFIFFPLLLTLSACGQQSSNKIQTVDPKAKKLNDSATLIAMKQQDYTKAISLLDQATRVDSNYLTAYRNKLSFQLELKQYDHALKTAFKMSQLRPDNPDYHVTIGVLYDIKGDSVTSRKHFTEATKYYNKILDTMSSANRDYDMLLMNKAINLVFVGEQQKGNDILRQLYSKQKDEIFKEILASYMNKSKHDILTLWMTPATSVSVAQPN